MKLIRGSLALAALLTGHHAFAQFVVYDNTGGTDFYGNVTGPTGGTAGDLVTLGGTARTITDFTVGLNGLPNLTGASTADLSLFLYDVSAPNSVGTQIGPTVTQTGITVQNGPFNVMFAVPNITVPDSFVWAVSIQNLTTGAVLGWTYSGTAAVGSSDSSFAYLNLPGFGLPSGIDTVLSNPSIPNNLTAVITAVPEPAIYPLLFGFLCLGLAVKHRSRRLC